ncbi:hypothetical protein V4F39_23425 [Aquincola sp. MAHUQ-54]|uniref:Flagellar protein FliT n=1 Tax=Aquincola agrisoli TaxID=3119538 RepID=A0AAW9QQL7_9BURK
MNRPIQNEPATLAREHTALVMAYGQVQRRCSRLMAEQAALIERQSRELMRLRAAVILRDTALGWAHEDRAELEAAVPGLPTRRALAQRVDALVARVHALLRERDRWGAGTVPSLVGKPRGGRGFGPAA